MGVDEKRWRWRWAAAGWEGRACGPMTTNDWAASARAVWKSLRSSYLRAWPVVASGGQDTVS